MRRQKQNAKQRGDSPPTSGEAEIEVARIERSKAITVELIKALKAIALALITAGVLNGF